jgi:HTH-like domain
VTVYRHISAERAHCDLPVSLMCELLEVSESGYWAWCARPPSDRALHDAWLTERIRAIHGASGGRYGRPRVHAMLRREGIFVAEKRVERLMRLAGLQGAHRRRRKGCTVRVPGVEPFPDLEFNQIPRLVTLLDQLQRVDRSHNRFVTDPPNSRRVASGNRHSVSPGTAGRYINWAEYLSWRNPQIASTMQFLLNDPNPTQGESLFGYVGFAAGLIFYSGKPKADYYTYRLPLLLPISSTRPDAGGLGLRAPGITRRGHPAGPGATPSRFTRCVPNGHDHPAYERARLFRRAGEIPWQWPRQAGMALPEG